MEDNNKLFVFEKKEVALIFIFIIIIAITAFTLGVRVGKKLSLKEDGFTKQDIANIELKSVDEEYVNTITNEGQNSDFENSMNRDKQTASQDDIELRLKEEMEKLAKDKVVPEKIEEPAKDTLIESSAINTQVKEDDSAYIDGESFEGKYSIQLYANQSKSAAQDFADGFILKGYDVIINEVQIPGKGKWYRVSIGVFDTVNLAKDYLQKEKDLFQGQKYIIKQL